MKSAAMTKAPVLPARACPADDREIAHAAIRGRKRYDDRVHGGLSETRPSRRAEVPERSAVHAWAPRAVNDNSTMGNGSDDGSDIWDSGFTTNLGRAHCEGPLSEGTRRRYQDW